MIIYDCQISDSMMIKKCYTTFQSKTNVTKDFKNNELVVIA